MPSTLINQVIFSGQSAKKINAKTVVQLMIMIGSMFIPKIYQR